MIRLTWRQFRAQAALAIGALAAVAILCAITGAHLAQLYDSTVATCRAHGDCPAVTAAFSRNDSSLRTWLGVLVVVVPGIIGMFWGAPLAASELETGTLRLAWTQSVTRTRWLAVKLGVVGLASMTTAGFLSLIVTWWARPLDQVGMNQFGTFDQRDLVPVGYAALAFVLGVTAGVVIRRTLPAMATTFVAFVVVRLAVTSWIRPALIAPLHRDFALQSNINGYGSSVSGLSVIPAIFTGGPPSTLQASPPSMPNAWINSIQIVDSSGHDLTSQVLKNDCPGLGNGRPASGVPIGVGSGQHTQQAPAAAQQTFHDCVAKISAAFHGLATYQPASRYWAFQWRELAIFLGGSLILAGFGLWWARHHLS